MYIYIHSTAYLRYTFIIICEVSVFAEMLSFYRKLNDWAQINLAALFLIEEYEPDEMFSKQRTTSAFVTSGWFVTFLNPRLVLQKWEDEKKSVSLLSAYLNFLCDSALTRGQTFMPLHEKISTNKSCTICGRCCCLLL